MRSYLIILFVFYACSQNASDNAVRSMNAPGAVASTVCSSNSSKDKKNTKNCTTSANAVASADKDEQNASENTEEENFNPDHAVPSYRSEEVGRQFNQTKIEKDKPDPLNAGKVFMISRVPYYKIIWMNLTQKNWADSAHNWAVNNISQPLSKGGFAGAGDIAQQPDRISIFQPIPELKIEAIAQGGFRVVGYAANNKLALPSFSTAVLAATPDQKSDIWAQPSDYQMIYNQGKPAYQELSEKCLTQEAQMEIFVNTQLYDICSGYLPEIFGNYLNTVNSNSYSIDGSGAPVRWKDWFKAINVAIWRPIPPSGYSCLGYLASNDGLDKPKIEMADPQSGPSSRSEQAALYCIKSSYVVEGILGEEIGKTIDGKVAFYKIKAKDPTVGYDDANFFYAKAYPELAEQKDEKLWVLKKNILRVLEDSIDNSSNSVAPVKK